MHEFERSTPVTVALRAYRGHVELTAEERDTVQVEVQPLDGSTAAREAAERTRVLLDGDTLVIQPPGTDVWAWRRAAPLRITARVPVGSSLSGKADAGKVRATGVWSLARVTAQSADIELDEILGDADLESASGEISATRIGGAVRAKGLSGRLRLGDVTGDVDMRTTSSAIRLARAGGSVRATSASGDIEIGELRQGRVLVKTASGDVRVGVAAGTGVWLDLESASGRTTSDLSAPRGEAAGGPASLEVRIRTASGDITVLRATGATPL